MEFSGIVLHLRRRAVKRAVRARQTWPRLRLCRPRDCGSRAEDSQTCSCSTTLALSPHVRGPHNTPRAPPNFGYRTSDLGAPNYVTPLLEKGDQWSAQNASRVQLPGYNASELYSGFFTIDAATESNAHVLHVQHGQVRPRRRARAALAERRPGRLVAPRLLRRAGTVRHRPEARHRAARRLVEQRRAPARARQPSRRRLLAHGVARADGDQPDDGRRRPVRGDGPVLQALPAAARTRSTPPASRTPANTSRPSRTRSTSGTRRCRRPSGSTSPASPSATAPSTRRRSSPASARSSSTSASPTRAPPRCTTSTTRTSPR